jgi:hypothetical protein
MQVGDLVRDNKCRYGVVIEIRDVFKPLSNKKKMMFRILVQGQYTWFFAEDLEVVCK